MSIPSYSALYSSLALRELQEAHQAFAEEKHHLGMGCFSIANAVSSPIHANTIYGIVWHQKGRPKGDPEYGRHAFHGTHGKSMTDAERAAAVKSYLLMVKHFDEKFSSASSEASEKKKKEEEFAACCESLALGFKVIGVVASVASCAALLFTRSSAMPPKQFAMLPDHVVVGGGHFPSASGNVSIGAGHLLNAFPAAKAVLPVVPKVAPQADIILASCKKGISMDSIKGKMAVKIIKAHVADIEVRGPEWDRVQQESQDRAWERDYGDRMSKDPNDVRANDFEHMQ